MIKVLIFANCHGIIYKNALTLCDPNGMLEIEHIISYENIDNFENIKNKFSECDILIIQPVQNYDRFKVENLLPLLKKECTVIRVPFIRFNGYWDKQDVRELDKFSQPAVMFFPNIQSEKDVSQYLYRNLEDESEIQTRFESGLEEMKSLEGQGDVKFVDFFIENHQTIPLFRDPYHPTKVIYDFISYQLAEIIHKKIPSIIKNNTFSVPNTWDKEYGHFKPIKRQVATTLGLMFDLDSYFRYPRVDYLKKILIYQNSSHEKVIDDLVKLDEILNSEKRRPMDKKKNVEGLVEAKMTKVLIFANCHGSFYKNAILRSGFSGTVDHVVSYENLDRFTELEVKFREADVLIIQPVHNYPEFKTENLKKTIKPTCLLIQVPFFRFDGFWPKNDTRPLKRFSEAAVMFFPKINIHNEVSSYLLETETDEKLIRSDFEKSLVSLRNIEKTGDISFADFFLENYKKVPMMHDQYHWRSFVYEYIAAQILEKIESAKKLGLKIIHERNELRAKKEYGFFKPIKNVYAKALGLTFDLNSYFPYNRFDYLSKILAYENDLQPLEKVNNLTEVKEKILEKECIISKPVDAGTKIFIVTPCFNAEATIARTIASVVSQSGNFKLHYHIQDGGSTDSTVAIIKKWEKLIAGGEYPISCNGIKFTYNSSSDAGMYDAIVKGLASEAVAHNTWLSWINADDIFFPNAFGLLVKLDSAPALSAIQWLTGSASLNRDDVQVNQSERLLAKDLIAKGLCDGKFWSFVQQEGTFFKKSLWDKLDKYNDFSSLKYAGDWNLWRRFAQYADIYQFEFPLGSFTVRPGQLSQVARSDYENEIEEIVSLERRTDAFKRVDVNKTFALYLIPSWKDASLSISRKSIQKHYEFRQNQIALKKQEASAALRNKPEKTSSLIEENGIVAYDKNWQFPAITEQYAFQKLREHGVYDKDSVYVAFPWATLIDLLHTKKPGSDILMETLDVIRKKISGKRSAITVCQHVLMPRFQKVFADLGITDVFWTHAIKGQSHFPDYHGIRIHPFPLYPVQAVENTDGSELERSVLFSFVGARADKWYLTQSRNHIIDFLSEDRRGLVIGRDEWHYNKIVYHHQISKVGSAKNELVDSKASQEFKEIVQKSIFSLCPSGSGPNSIRLWESIGLGTIPVILADTYMPPGDPALWEEAAVFCDETEEAIKALPDRLEAIAQDPKLLMQKRQAMRQIWMMYGPDCFVYDIQKLLLSQEGSDASENQQWNDAVFNTMVSDFLDTPAEKSFHARLLVQSLISRILTSPEYIDERYQKDHRLREACHLAMQHAPDESVQRLKRISSMKNIALV